ncbi:MAG: AAA family ATPase [Gemmatimonadetes bacterium]|nr:AAA family ATPase [Gemmatimonadota bacterium]
MNEQKNYWLMALGGKDEPWLESDCYEKGIAAIGWDDLGDLSQYDSQEDISSRGLGNNSSLACWQFCREMKPGDVIFVKRGVALLVGHGKVQSCYRFDGTRPWYMNVRDVEWLSNHPNGVPYEQNRLPSKVLTKVTKMVYLDDLKRTLGMLSEDDDRPPPETSEETGGDIYTSEEAGKDLFMSEDEIRALVTQLKRKKNLVLQGPPGTGKTYLAKRLAWLLAGTRSEERIETVQFHQSFGYEDFVRGYRPTASGGFELKDGPFLHFCELARQQSDKPFVLIIDEINRGNLSRILGELLMLIEADKRSEEWEVRMAYSNQEEDKFFVPPNLYLIGTMNTADRSLALVDYALRRRFAFWTVNPAFKSDGFTHHLKKRDAPDTLLERIRNRLETLNKTISEDPRLGEGFQIGHSYFCELPKDLSRMDAWYEEVLRHEIKPLIDEYWFDDSERAKSAFEDLLRTD